MKPEILVNGPIYAPVLAALEQEYAVHKPWLAPDADACIKQAAPNIRGVVTTGLRGFSAQQMAALPKLEIVASFGNPRRTIDLAAAKARGIFVTNTPDYISGAVADIALALMLSVMRRVTEGDRYVRAGKWEQAPMAAGRDLNAKVCGIVGLGRIGCEIAKRVQAFGMRVEYYGRHKKDDVAFPFHADLTDLARAADCLVVVCPLTNETRGLINAKVLDALGAEGFLINVARGPVVDQQALIAALRDRRIAGAGLDVFWDEPRVPPELMSLENLVMTPHIGTTTREVRDERARKVLANLKAHFAGQPVLNPLTEDYMI